MLTITFHFICLFLYIWLFTFSRFFASRFRLPHPSTYSQTRDAPGRSYTKHLLSGNNAHLRRPLAPHKPHYYDNSPIRAYQGRSSQEILPYKNTLGNPGCPGCVVAEGHCTRLCFVHNAQVEFMVCSHYLHLDSFLLILALCCCRLSFIFIVYSPRGHKFSVSFFLTNSTMSTRN